MSSQPNGMFAHWLGAAVAEERSAVDFFPGSGCSACSSQCLENTALTMQWCGNAILGHSRDVILVPCGRILAVHACDNCGVL